MYCEKCGMLNEDDAKFCVGCGESLLDEIQNDSNSSTAIQQEQKKEEANQSIKETMVKLNKKTVVIFFVVLVLLITGCIGGVALSKRVNIANYIDYSNIYFTGYEEHAYLDIDEVKENIIDYDTVSNLLTGESNWYSNFDYDDGLIDTKMYINGKEIDNDYFNANNGDKFKIVIKPNYEKINKAYAKKKKLVGNKVITKEIEVSGLEKTTSFNPFDCIKAVYRNEDGGSIYYQPSDEEIKINDNYTMSLEGNAIKATCLDDSANNFSLILNCSDEYTTVGKTVTIEIEDDDIIDYGLKISQYSKDYTMNLYKTFKKSDIDILSKEQLNTITNSAKLALGELSSSDSVKLNSVYITDSDFYIVFENESSDRKFNVVSFDFWNIYKDHENNIIYIAEYSEGYDNPYELSYTCSSIQEFEDSHSFFGDLSKVTIKGE